LTDFQFLLWLELSILPFQRFQRMSPDTWQPLLLTIQC
jgi:hypothetical protein